MKVTHNLHEADVVELTKSEISDLLAGHTFVSNGIHVKMERKPDVEYRVRAFQHSEGPAYCPHLAPATEIQPPNIKLVFSGETGKLKSAEVL